MEICRQNHPVELIFQKIEAILRTNNAVLRTNLGGGFNLIIGNTEYELILIDSATAPNELPRFLDTEKIRRVTE